MITIREGLVFLHTPNTSMPFFAQAMIPLSSTHLP